LAWPDDHFSEFHVIAIRKSGFLVWLCLGTNVLGVVATCFISIRFGGALNEIYALSDLAIELLFQFWALAPYVVLLVFLLKSCRIVRQRIVFLFSSLVIVGFGLFEYSFAYFIVADAQAGLLFIFVPAYQLLGAGVGIGCTIVAGRVWRRKHESCDPS